MFNNFIMEKTYNLIKLSIKKMLCLFLLLSVGVSTFAQGSFELVVAATTATCEVATDGTAYVESQTGGVEPLTYLWNDGQDFVVAYDLPLGTYTVTATDATGATAVGSATVVLAPESIWLMPTSTAATCGACNGTANPMAMLGVPPYTYEWSDGQTTETATGLCPGTYGVTVTDTQGCVGIDDNVVVEDGGNEIPEAGDISTNDNTTVCVQDGTPDPITIIVEGASEDATLLYVVTDENGVIVATSNGPNFDFEMGTGGVGNIYLVAYFGTITNASIGDNIDDIEGCVDIAGPVETVRIEVTPYDISTDDATTFCVSDGAENTVTATAEGGSGDTDAAWIIVDADLNILGIPGGSTFDFTNVPAGVCYIHYVSWNGDIDGLEVSENVADLEGCLAVSAGIEVNRVDVTASIEVVANISQCGAADGSLQVVVEGAEDFSVEWSNGATTEVIDGLEEGTYSVTVMDADGACTVTEEISIFDDGIDIGDYVWFDNNENCSQDHYENGVAFVPVDLYSVGEDGIACNEDDVLIASTGTNADGFYLFECVPVNAGVHYIQFNALAVQPDYMYSCQNEADDAIDSDVDPETGKTDPFDVELEDILTIDAGIFPICNDLNWGGQIGPDQTICPGEVAATIGNVISAGGGGQRPIEYLWMCTTDVSNLGSVANWTIIPNSNSASLEPGPVYSTKYFIRCARRMMCDQFIAESNVVTIEVVSCGTDNDNAFNISSNVNSTKSVTVYPNPMSDVLNIETTTGMDSDVTVDLMSLDGKLIQTLTLDKDALQTEQISTSDLPEGTYFVKITDAQGNVETVKVAKVK